MTELERWIAATDRVTVGRGDVMVTRALVQSHMAGMPVSDETSLLPEIIAALIARVEILERRLDGIDAAS